MDLERDKPQPEMDPQRRPATPEPRVQRLGPRQEPEPVPASRQPPPPRPPKPPTRNMGSGWGMGRIAAILLLLISGGVLIGGSDEKPSPPSAPTSVIDQAESVPDEIVVDLKDNITDAQIAGLGQAVGIQLRYASAHSAAYKLMVARVNPGDRGRVLAGLRASPLVEAAEPQILYHFDQASSSVSTSRFVPNDPDYKRQWDLTMIGMEEAWTKTKGKGATVAVIDSGVGGRNPAGGVVQGQDFNRTEFATGYDFGEDIPVGPDDDGHGTHVSGTIAESTDNGLFGAGIAPEAKLMPLRVADAKGQLKLSAIADALHYAGDHGANVANLSLGGPSASDIMASSMRYAYDKGVTLVCAAGNDGKDDVGYPAKYKECITVSAVGPTGEIASYSTWGKEVDIAAPGGEPKMGEDALIYQNTFMQKKGLFGPSGPRVDGFFPMFGTSMAAPHVTGVAALLVSLGIKDPSEIRSQLRKTAKVKTPADHYGAGILDAAAAVQTTARSERQNWVQIALAIGAAGLLLTIGRNLRRPTDPMFFVHHIAIALAVGLFLPIALEKFVGFGSWWNLVGHSVVLGIIFLVLPGLDRSSFWKAVAFTLGLVIHLLLDADSGRAPFLVIPQQRILFWLAANAAVGIYFMVSTYSSAKKEMSLTLRAA